MKKFRNILLLLIGLLTVAGAMTSCVGDDTQDYMIPAETYQQYLRQMSGTYSGHVRFFRPTSANSSTYQRYDSINTSWKVGTDSIVVVNNFPVAKLDSAIVISSTDDSETATTLLALRNALSQVSPTELHSIYFIPNTNFVSTTAIQFYVNPYALEVPVTYNGETHKIYFIFQSNYYGGVYYTTAKTFEYAMQLYCICIDQADEAHKIASRYVQNVQITCTTK